MCITRRRESAIGPAGDRWSVARRLSTLICLFVAVMALGPRAASAASDYSVTYLGALPGGTAAAVGMNNSEQIVGSGLTAAGGACCIRHAFSFTPASGLADLGTLSGTGSQAYGSSSAAAVNNAGEIVGESTTASGSTHAFSYTSSGGMIDLGTIPGDFQSDAFGINDSGEIVGSSRGARGVYHTYSNHAFFYTPSGGMVDLGTLPGGSDSGATGVNAGGQIVGSSSTASGPTHAFSYTPAGGMVDLGTLPGDYVSGASGVNDSGQIVGSSSTASSVTRAFSYTPAGGMVDLGTLPGDSVSAATAVNDTGEIVGFSVNAKGVAHAFSYTPAGGMVNLGTFPGGQSEASGVNDSGQIVGFIGDTAVLWQQGKPTTVSCSLQSISVGQSTTCTVTVSNDTAPAPTGLVEFASDGAGTFAGGPCTLATSAASASCQVTYTPTAVGATQHTLTATYDGDAAHLRSAGQTTIAVTRRATATAVSCLPTSVLVAQPTTCTATVVDTGTGTSTTPAGTIRLSTTGSGDFSPTKSCTLSGSGISASCSVSYAPSAAGPQTITATYAGDKAHAGSNGTTQLEVNAGTAPTCKVTATIAGPPKQVQVTVQDTGSGLESVVVTKSTNSTTIVPPFTPGTTSPVVITSTKQDQSQSSELALTVSDVAGHVTICDPTLIGLSHNRAKTQKVRVRHLAQAESKVMIVNGWFGVHRVQIVVDGKVVRRLVLRSGQTRNIDVAKAMRPGHSNTITMILAGRAGGAATVAIHD